MPDFAVALVDVQDAAAAVLFRIDEPEASGNYALAEQALTRADDHRKLPDAQRVDEIVLEQGLEQLAAAMHLDFSAIQGLELCNRVGDIAIQQGGVVPTDFVERARRHVFRPGVECCRDLVCGVGLIGPVAREDLIGLAAEEEGTGAVDPVGHHRAEFLVGKGNHPAAVLEATFTVLVRTAGRLHDTVKRQKCACYQLSHVVISFDSIYSIAIWREPREKRCLEDVHSTVNTTESADRCAGPWKTASTLLPSGSSAKAA